MGVPAPIALSTLGVGAAPGGIEKTAKIEIEIDFEVSKGFGGVRRSGAQWFGHVSAFETSKIELYGRKWVITQGISPYS